MSTYRLDTPAGATAALLDPVPTKGHVYGFLKTEESCQPIPCQEKKGCESVVGTSGVCTATPSSVPQSSDWATYPSVPHR